MAASLYAKVLSEQEVTTIITKQQEEKKKLDVELLNPDNYLYKGSPLNLGISLNMIDIKEQNTFFEVDNDIIIILDRFRRCWNAWISCVNPIGEWKSDNGELLEILPKLSIVERGNLHNQLADKLYNMSSKFCRFWSKFLDSLDMLNRIELRNFDCYLLSDISIRNLFYKNCFYLIHVDLDKVVLDK